MRIRVARDDDAAAVAALWTEGYSGRGGSEGRQAPYSESGAATWGVGRREAGLSRLVVGEGARGRGVGRALAELCVAQAREAGAEAIVLWSRRYQAGAHRLYESLGFRRAPQRDSTDADGARWIFVLDLTERR